MSRCGKPEPASRAPTKVTPKASTALRVSPPACTDLRAARNGFATVVQKSTIVDVGSVIQRDLTLRVADVAVTLDVVAPNPLIETASPVVGGVVGTRRIEELPLNGRQFANLAATLPGTGIAFHRDPTKGTQYTPQVSGGSGRNVNYLVDGGDNNDDTVGGQLQMFPLDSIDEFRFSIAGYGAATGRSGGGVMNVVTKSGTNRLSGSGFTFFRDDALNARTITEQRSGVPKSAYRRWQSGGSAGGPIVRDRAHFFAAAEGVVQNTFQPVGTLGLFREKDGVFPVHYGETLATVKTTTRIRAADHAWLRYGFNGTSQPAGVGPLRPLETWSDNRNRFHSINGAYASILGPNTANEVAVQYATFLNTITSDTTASTERFPNGVVVGLGLEAPQGTQQRKLHVRDDFTWHISRGAGLGHELKTGVSVAHDPNLGLLPQADRPGYFSYVHQTDDPRGPITAVSGILEGTPIVQVPPAQTPLTQTGVYVQDDWRASSRLTIDAGLRYDVAFGYQIDQSKNPNFVALQSAGRSGRLDTVIGLEDFGKTPRNDYDNLQPRVGATLQLDGEGRNVLRASWGVYTDMAYTNGNILFAAFDARGDITTSFFNANDSNGLRNPDGSFFVVGEPVSNLAALNQGSSTGLVGEVISPRLQQPYTRQVSVGWSHQVDGVTAFRADVIHAGGRNLNVRARLNTRPSGGARRFADLGLDPASGGFRFILSPLESVYDAMLLSLTRRSTAGLDFALNYTLSRAKSQLGQSVDETGLGPNTIQDATDPFATVSYGPAASDARHLISLTAIVPLKADVQIAPLFLYRSALPVLLVEGVDRNNDFSAGQPNPNDIPDRAYAFDGIGRAPRDIGPCRTINCGRGAGSSQFNLRVSKRFTAGASRVTVIAEGFNLFNDGSPSGFNARRLVVDPVTRQLVLAPEFLQPTAFAGDFQQPVQRALQFAVRWSF